MENTYKVDWKFISGLEGNNHHRGYQPTANSGVTIGIGFDLKDKTPQSLKAMGFDDLLIQRLDPYLGLKGSQAKGLAKNLIMTDQETDTINRLSKAFYTSDIAKQYNKAANGNKFTDLTAAQQTVIASVGFQYGSLSRTPNFLSAAVEGRWSDVVKELNNFGDDFKTRRETEAIYLKERQNPTYFYAKEPVEEPKFYAKEPEEEPKFYAKEE